MKCNLCGGSEWADINTRKAVRCIKCSSLERTRALKFVLDHHKIPKADANILHLAPEKSFSSQFERSSPKGYDPVDYVPSLYPHTSTRKFDLTKDLPSLNSNHYDLILHIHVLEHIPMNIAPIFFHLHRALKPGGMHVFSIPFMNRPYDEYFGEMTPEVANQRFGQLDHVRAFGTGDIDRHLGSIVRVPKHYTLYDYGTKKDLDDCNIPEACRSGFTSHTIFALKKHDYLLSQID